MKIPKSKQNCGNCKFLKADMSCKQFPRCGPCDWCLAWKQKKFEQPNTDELIALVGKLFKRIEKFENVKGNCPCCHESIIIRNGGTTASIVKST